MKLEMFDAFAGEYNLNLGCAGNKITEPGKWINLDRNPEVRPDIVWDLEQGLPWIKFAGAIDLVFASHVLEHVKNLNYLMFCVWMSLKQGGHFIAVTPHASSDDAVDSPFHVSYFTENTWAYFIDKLYKIEGSGFMASQGEMVMPWVIEAIALVPVPEYKKWAQRDPEKFRSWSRRHRNTIQEVQAILRKGEQDAANA